MNLKELEDFLQEIPYNDKNVIPIQIVSEEFIITKTGKNTYNCEVNRNLPYSSIKAKKNEFQLENLKEIFKSGEKIKNRELWKTIIYVAFIFIIWLYFIAVNTQSIFIFFEQGFGNVSINVFLLWLYLISLIGWVHFLYENIAKPFIEKYSIPINFFNPSKIILKNTDINQFLLFSSQLVYFSIFYELYFPYTDLILIETLLRNYFVFLIVGIGISIHYLLIFLKHLSYNIITKKKSLTLLYSSIQNLDIQSENYHLILKMISDLENSKHISFGLVSIIVSIITFLLAIIPNILFTT